MDEGRLPMPEGVVENVASGKSLRSASSRALKFAWLWLGKEYSFHAILAAGVFLRVAALAMVGDTALRNEATGYYPMALQLLREESFAPYWPPGAAYYILFFLKIFGPSILVARAAILPLYVVFSVFLHRVVERLSSRQLASLFVLVFAVYPPYVRYSFNPSSEYLAAVCLMALVYLCLRTEGCASLANAALSGGLMGVLVLTRPSSLLCVIYIAVYLAVRSKRLCPAGIPLLVCSVLVSMWLFKAHELAGRFVWINDANAEDLFVGNNSYTPLYRTWPEGHADAGLPARYRELQREIRRLPEPERSQTYRELALAHIRARPDLFLLRTANRARAYFAFPVHNAEPIKALAVPPWVRTVTISVLTLSDVLFYWPIMALAVCCMWTRYRWRDFSDPLALIPWMAFLYALPYWFTFSQPRYNFPVVPLLALMAAAFLGTCLHGARRRNQALLCDSRRRRLGLVLTLALFFYSQLEYLLIFYGRL